MISGRKYIIPLDAIAHTAITDIWWIGAPTDAVVGIHEIYVGNDTDTDSEQLPIRVFRTATDNSAQGTSVTANPTHVGDAAFGGTVRRTITGGNLSAETTMLYCKSENVLNSWHWKAGPEDVIVLSPTAGTAGRLAINLNTAPADSITLSGYVVIEEIGG